MTKQAKVLTREQIEDVLRACKKTRNPERNRIIILLAFYAGLRSKEIAALRWKDVIGKKGEAYQEVHLTAKQTKGDEANTIRIGAKLRAEIEQYYRSQEIDDLSSALLPGGRSGSHMYASSIRREMMKLFALAEVPEGVTSHSGRRTFITRLSENGIEARAIQELARHKSLAMTQKYIELNPERLINAVDTLD